MKVEDFALCLVLTPSASIGGTSNYKRLPWSFLPPVFGVTSAGDANLDQNIVDNSKPSTVTGPNDKQVAQIAGSDLPSWLNDAKSAADLLSTLRAQAQASGNYFDTGSPSQNFSGTDADHPGFAFVDTTRGQPANLDGGWGLLVVNGYLEMRGNPTFSGFTRLGR
jgi:hypothetical protein